MSTYTEDHLVEQPAIQIMQHELGWDVMNCFGDPTSLKLRRTGWEVPGKAEMLKTEMLKRRKAIEPFFANHSSPKLRTAKATKVKAVEEPRHDPIVR